MSNETLFERKLRDVLDAELQSYVQATSLGASEDWGQYREQVGIVKTLRRIQLACETIRRQIDGASTMSSEEHSTMVN